MFEMVDLTGNVYGKLTVISKEKKKRGHKPTWLCKCECGNMVSVTGSNLQTGHTGSCGCSRKENPSQLKHGLSRTRIYRIWSLMKDRCNNPNSPAFANYGGRGIKVCDEWNGSVEAFNQWALENGYTDDMTIERIDVDMGYMPSNCKWIPRPEQNNNTRASRYIEYDGRTQSLASWCKEYGMPYKTVHARINRCGWDFERAITTPVDQKKGTRKKNQAKKGGGKNER